jgi:hypothetical protein
MNAYKSATQRQPQPPPPPNPHPSVRNVHFVLSQPNYYSARGPI